MPVVVLVIEAAAAIPIVELSVFKAPGPASEGEPSVLDPFSSRTYLPWRFRVKRRDLEVHVKGRLVVNSVTVARRAAVEGLGLIQGPPIFIATDLAEGRLVTVLDQWAPTPATGFFLYYPSRRQMRPALKALVDFLRKERRGR